ncbi:MAG: peptidylprolyl isomerase [Patescibacteria group bacterium]
MQKSWTFPGVLPAQEIAGKQVRIKTAKGDIVFDLYDKDAPKTVSNFAYLAKGGFFDGLTFHRRVEGFVIQGGDPVGTGTGGPGYKFEDEPVKRSYDRGIVAMANSGPDTNGSQFFIMLANTGLPPNYTIFGMVTSGMEAVDKIMVGDVMTKVTVEDKK